MSEVNPDRLAILLRSMQALERLAGEMRVKVEEVATAREELETVRRGLVEVREALDHASGEETELLEQQLQGWLARRDEAEKDSSIDRAVPALHAHRAGLEKGLQGIEGAIDALVGPQTADQWREYLLVHLVRAWWNPRETLEQQAEYRRAVKSVALRLSADWRARWQQWAEDGPNGALVRDLPPVLEEAKRFVADSKDDTLKPLIEVASQERTEVASLAGGNTIGGAPGAV